MTSKTNKDPIIAAVLLIILTLIVFQGVLHHDFITTDDHIYIVSNPHVTAGLSLRGIAWAFTTWTAANWHPLTWMSHMLDCSLYGMNPAGHHATSLLIHLANVLLLFLLLLRMTGNTWRSAVVAALFAIHPLHVESVAWAAERKDVLSAFFWMLTMWAYVLYTERPVPAKYALILLTFALGLMSKPVLVTLPFALLLLDYWPLGRYPKRRWSSLVWEKVPLFGLAGASGLITCIAQQKGEALVSLQNLPMGVRIANASVSYVTYLCKTFWPSNLAIMYPHPQATLPSWQVIGSALVLALLTLLVLKGRSRPYVTVGWLWYLGILAPMIGLIQVGGQAMADRYTYIPLIGLFIIITWGIAEWKRWVSVKAVIACMIIIALGIAAGIQVGYWKDAYTVFLHADQVTANNYLANSELGNVLRARGRLDEAAQRYRKALEILPRYEMAHLGLGIVLARQGRFDEAADNLREAIAIRPDYAEAHFVLAACLAGARDPEGAAKEYAEVIRLSPNGPDPYMRLADISLRLNKPDAAISAYRGYLKLAPDDAAIHYKLAMLLIGKGDMAGARDELEHVVRLKPDDVVAQYNLGLILASQDDLDGAISRFTKAIETKPSFVFARERLAQAYFYTGNYAGAWEQVHICRQYGHNPDPALVKSLRAKMPER